MNHILGVHYSQGCRESLPKCRCRKPQKNVPKREHIVQTWGFAANSLLWENVRRRREKKLHCKRNVPQGTSQCNKKYIREKGVTKILAKH